MDQSTCAINNLDPYYLKSIAELSKNSDVISCEDIYSQTGIKLINKGTQLNQDFYKSLVQHKLAVSRIDRSLTVKGAVTPHSLARDAARLLDEEEKMARMAKALPDRLLLRNALAQIPLNAALAFKLTLMRETRPELYRHSIRVALISLYLGASSRLKREDLTNLATAAMFHDLGELHIDPALLETGRQINSQERQHIYAHPMIAYLILREFPEYHPHISKIVLEHHERLDGSGYPRNVEGAQISLLGQILTVAEVAGSLCGPTDQANACARVEVILKLNSGQFRSDLVGYLSALAQNEHTSTEPEDRVVLAKIGAGLENIASILAGWDQTCAPHHAAKPHECLTYTHKRLARLETGLFSAGFNPDKLDALTKDIEEDPHSLSELGHLVSATDWQLKDTLYEIRRRWPEFETASDPAALALRHWASHAEQLLQA